MSNRAMAPAVVLALLLPACGSGHGAAHHSPTPQPSVTATPPSLQSVQSQLVTPADVTGSAAVPVDTGHGSDPRNAVMPCLHPGSGRGDAGNAQVAAAEVQQPQTQPAPTTVVEVVLLYSGPTPAAAAQQAGAAMLQLQTASRSCPPTASTAPQSAGAAADTETTVTSQVALGPWSGVRSVDAITITSATAAVQVLHQVYDVATPKDPFLVLELDIAMSGVAPSQQLQQQADLLATTLALRLAA